MSKFPKPYAPSTLARLYKKLPLSEETVALLHRYFAAAANLYGIIPLRKLWEIINRQNVEKISEEDFAAFSEIVRREEQEYLIVGDDELYSDGETQSGLDRQLAQAFLLEDYDDYYTLHAHQSGKPFYVPPKSEFLRYEDDGYYERTNDTDALRNYFRTDLKMGAKRAEDTLADLLLIEREFVSSLQEVLDTLPMFGIEFRSERQAVRFVELYNQVHNNTRMWCNCGYTPVELSKLFRSEDSVPQSMSFGPGLRSAIADGTIPADELRQEIMKMNIPNEQLRASILSEITNVEPAQSVPVRATKIGRNDPCPCGSGKKYKKCCGR